MNLIILAEGFWRFLLPEQVSSDAATTDWGIKFIFWISLFFFVLIMVVGTIFVVRFRKRPGVTPGKSPSHHTGLELTWTIIPLILVVVIFAVTFFPYMRMYGPPANAYEVKVIARKWAWDFEYDGGGDSTNVLHVPAGRPVRLVLTSIDVVHSFYVPEFRLKRDAVPGRFNHLWFQADKPGVYPLYCAEYCGKEHSLMVGTVVVHTEDDFKKTLAELRFDPLEELTPEQYTVYVEQGIEALRDKYPDDAKLQEAIEAGKLQTQAQRGEKLYSEQGCNSCHSIDGTPRVGGGPSFLYTWRDAESGATEFNDGSTLKDWLGSNYTAEDYIRESIIEPNARIVAGYRSGAMSSYKGRISDREIMAIIAYLKELSEKNP